MSGADIYAKANDAFFDDDYDEALDLFTQAIQAEPKNPEFILKRCVVYQKLSKYQEAATDAKTALKILEESQGSRTLLARAHLQTGITQHHLKNYTEAQQHFEASKELNPTEKTLVTWLRKNADKIPKVEPSPPVVPQVLGESSAVKPTPQQARVRHEWFQNESFITVEVFMKNIKPDTVSLEFFETSLSLSIKMPSGSDYSLELDPLAHEILPKESSYKILSTKLEIKLKKKQAGILWGALESENDQGSAMAAASTSGKKAKDWNKLVKDIDQDQEKAQGEEALNGLFQQIYKDADEDTKRAMMKSFVESNGTCLSTNWSEVGSGTVETKPPEGMVAKKY
ncbi:SGT1-like protein Git7 [Absidia repens]|uniref:SGT1-like protein Git7 n=1 Tax=Absidia repens TaxID=90262 RepID=A0A1X2ICZ8_9FUNG|nr:SGT1-like protein Git7 [Absidia repens]